MDMRPSSNLDAGLHGSYTLKSGTGSMAKLFLARARAEILSSNSLHRVRGISLVNLNKKERIMRKSRIFALFLVLGMVIGAGSGRGSRQNDLFQDRYRRYRRHLLSYRRVTRALYFQPSRFAAM